MSPAASTYSAEKAPTDEPTHKVEELNEYADAEVNYQPKSLKFWAIIFGMYVSIFLVALVSILNNSLKYSFNKSTGSNDYCDCDPQNH